MKKYKTWEVIKMLTENPELKFETEVKDIDIKQLISVNDLNILDLKGEGCSDGVDGNLLLSCEWTLAKEPVAFMDAIKAYGKGKTIRCELKCAKGYCGIYKRSELSNCGGYDVTNAFGVAIGTREILEGKWYIEEDAE